MQAPRYPAHIVVLSSLFPSQLQPGAGLFIRERMFRVGQRLPLSVVAPSPWFPLQGLLRRFKPHFRPGAPRYEKQAGVDVWFPRFLSIPGVLKGLDGWLMAIGAYATLRRLQREGRLDIIDAHFAYPDGYAASLLGNWLQVPVTITLRGTETRHLEDARLAPLLLKALQRATRVFSVSESLKKLVVARGAAPAKIEVVGNGVDTVRFSPRDRVTARASLGLSPSAPVLISVGGLVSRKGFHRVIEILPQLRRDFPGLVYLVVGGPSAEGDNRAELETQVAGLGLQDCVHFLGPRSPDVLADVLSAADVFVLATSNEGWANVFLEAMACGLPVVTTDVGGNREVVRDASLGVVVPFGDAQLLAGALAAALGRNWDRAAIRRYAEENSWGERVERLCGHFQGLVRGPSEARPNG